MWKLLTHGTIFSEANLAYVKKSASVLRAGKGTAYELTEGDDAGPCVGGQVRRRDRKVPTARAKHRG